MDVLVENDTWELVDRPQNVKVIDNRWVLRTKLNVDGLIKRLRARLFAKGHVQMTGINLLAPKFF
jgi:predicted metalloprotease